MVKKIYFSFRGFILRLMPIRIEEKDFKAVEIKSILVIRIDRIGDLIFSIPSLKALRQVFPKAKISVLVCKQNYALLNGFSWIDEVLLYKGFIKTIGQLRQERIDLAVDLLVDYSVKTALLAYLSKAKFVAGFDIEARGCFFNLKFKPGQEKKHISQHILDLVKVLARYRLAVDIPFESVYPEIPILEQNKNYSRSFLKEKGIREDDLLVGIHPGGHYATQRWPIDRFGQLADRIIERYKAKVLVVGGPSENGLVEKMIELMKKEAIKIVGFPLDKLASLISLMDLFICNNSGPLHIACALNIPTVSTMGPTDPFLWWPMGENHIVVKRDLSCSPCNRAICSKHDCMKLITVEDMLQAVGLQMENKSEEDSCCNCNL